MNAFKWLDTVTEDDEIDFDVATNLDYYGDGAVESDVDDYSEFAEQWLLEKTGCKRVEIHHVENYKFGDGMNDLRNKIWDDFCRSH